MIKDYKTALCILTIFVPYILFSSKSEQFGSDNNTQTEIVSRQIETAFNEAELEVFGKDIKPEIIVGPDPDPKKCVCKGTGKIVHGDGHTTDCPFHQSKLMIKKLNSGDTK